MTELMNPLAGRRTAVEGLVSQAMYPSEGPKSTGGFPQYTITLTKATNFFENDAVPSDRDISISIIKDNSEESAFGTSLQELTGGLDVKALEGKWIRVAYDYTQNKKSNKWFATRTLEAVSETPFQG